MTVFVDTSAFVAILDRDEPRRRTALDELAGLRASATSLLTHEYVIVEATALVQRRLGMAALGVLVEELLPLCEVAWVDPELHLAARQALLAARRRGVSLADWVSFLVMRRRGIRTAFAFDADFATEGFELLPTPP